MPDTERTLFARWLGPSGVSFVRRNLEIVLGPLGSLTLGDTMRQYDNYSNTRHGLSPSGHLLEYQMGDVWGPLCIFMDKDVPNVPFPHKNDSVMMGYTDVR
ncbi:hypothetical protein C8R45DRAFT_875086 [Mycena sanguinolenta]|nr:hypothetical protein C8R45DRAFT_875086 [Mycena sanguinolenta]